MSSPHAVVFDPSCMDERRAVIRGSGMFDPMWYRERYPDVDLVGLDPLDHYIRIGCLIGRDPSPLFDSRWYLDQNPSVAEAGFDPLYHYVKWGRAQGWKVRAVGSACPTIERNAPNRGVKRKLEVWDEEREASFLGDLEAIYESRCGDFDEIEVSIVMPTFNRADTIEGAIRSVVAQSHTNWTLAIADDGSDDATPEVVGRFAGDNRIRFLPGPKQGVSAARNRALQAARGKYVFYLDSDNAWRPNFLRSMLVFMEAGGLAASYSAAWCRVDAGKSGYFRGDDFVWTACLEQNYVDMNCFAHRRELFMKYGGFDESLRRLVDWELILRFTVAEKTAFAPFVGVDYDDTTRDNRITHSEYRKRQELLALAQGIRERFKGANNPNHNQLRPIAESILASAERAKVERTAELVQAGGSQEALRIGYVLWDWPALSQTFVLNEIRELCRRGHDVRVFYKVKADTPARLDFQVEAELVADERELVVALQGSNREVMHSPFVYPAGTLLAWPASQETGIPFTLMAGGVDVTHEKNIGRNLVDRMTADALCLGVITLGSFHRDFLLERGVPSNKLILERQAVSLPEQRNRAGRDGSAARAQVLSVGRFIEKKGFEHLIRAAVLLPEVDIRIHGYGPLEGSLRELRDELGASNVEFAGALPDAQALHDAYGGADAFVLPCVQAANGDLDGMPTVLLEAMAAGVRVATTDVANIPDLVIDGVTGVLCPPGDARALASSIRRLLQQSTADRERMQAAARERVVRYANVDRTVDTLVHAWRRQCIDIVLVTYDTEQYPNISDTLEIIDRIYRFTATPFQIIVADNDSRPEFKRAVLERFGTRPNFQFIQLEKNILCGPASNIAMAVGESPYIIYVCSKEGFVLRHGWERQMIRALDCNPRAAIAGHLVPLGKFARVGDLVNFPGFDRWRERDFAVRGADVPFVHVQGGLYALRRSAFKSSGGFNPRTPHDGMDVEFSFLLQSKGMELASVPGLAAITTKTLPRLRTLVDEFSFAVHPSTFESVESLDAIVANELRFCPLCDWHGDEFGRAGCCPKCGSLPFSRSVHRILSATGVLQSRPQLLALVRDSSLEAALSNLCGTVSVDCAPFQSPGCLRAAAGELLSSAAPGSIVVVESSQDRAIWPLLQASIRRAVAKGVHVLAGAQLDTDRESLERLVASAEDETDFHARSYRLMSRACGLHGDLACGFSNRPWPRYIQGLDC